MTYQRNETPEPLASATPITEAFEARYQRSAEDPTSAEMLAIFSEGWNARGTFSEALMPEPVATVDADGFLVVLGGYIPTHAKLYTADQLHEAIRAATERAAKQEWLPIATAPRDGKPIILGFAIEEEYGGFVAQGRWHEDDDDGPDNMGHDAGFMDDQFDFFTCARSFGNPAYRSTGLQPTHWMPLPDAPEAAAIRSSGGLGASDE